MIMAEQYLFDEKQYLGRDMTWISVRLILALFCFIAYYVNFDQVVSRQLFFIVGAGILVVSIIMLYLISYRTVVHDRTITLTGLWTSNPLTIDLSTIRKVEVKPYSRFVFNSVVYNLHKNNKIRFYSGGKDALWLTDTNGLTYVIGSQRPQEFKKAIEAAKSKS